MKTLLKHYSFSALVLSVGISAYAANITVNDALTQDTKWADLNWSGGALPTTGDTVFLDLPASDYNVVIGGNEDYSVGRLYIRQHTNLVVGDDSGDAASLTITGSDNNEFQHYGSLVIKSNGTVNLAGSSKFQFYNTQETEGGYALLVDGGTFNGHFNVGSTVGAGTSIVKFQNGGIFNRNTEVNPLGMQGKAQTIFDNSTYNVWNSANSQNNGFGNHVINISTDNTNTGVNTQMLHSFQNGSIVNGAGIVGSGTVEYYDFSTKLKDLSNASSYTKVPLTLQIQRLANSTDYYTLEILSGAKVSAGGLILGSNNTNGNGSTDLNPRRTATGTLNFIMEGSQGKVSQYAGFGDTWIYLSAAYDATNDQPVPIDAVWNFHLKGNTSFDSNGNFNVSDTNILGGTLNFVMSGDNNYFYAQSLNLNGGSGNFKGQRSNAVINMTFGEDQNGVKGSNNDYSFNALNLTAGADSQINVKLSGGSGTTFTPRSHVAMTSSNTLGGTSVNRVTVDGLTYTINNQLQFNNIASGMQEFVVKKGADVTYSNINWLSNASVAGGNAESYLVIDGGKFTSTGDVSWNANNALGAGKVGIKMTGNGGEFLANSQMNIYGTTGAATGNFIVDITGTNNKFTANQNMHMYGQMANDSMSYVFNMEGSGNTAQFTRLNLGTTTNMISGLSRIISKSADENNKNRIYLGNSATSNYALEIHGATDSDTVTMKSEFILAGNTVLRSGDQTTGIHLKLWEYGGTYYKSGYGLFEISGSGNDALFAHIQVGNNLATGGNATFRVKGGGSTIVSNGNFQIRKGAESATWANPESGTAILEFVIDNTGISTIQVDTSIIELTGLLHLDFSFLTSPDMANERYVLISAKDSSLKSKLSNWITNFDTDAVSERVMISGTYEGDTLIFDVEEGSDGYYDFVMYYSSIIPEPSAYAAIIGVLALGAAAYRRRKN